MDGARPLALALILLTAGLAGCLSGGEDVSPANATPEDSSTSAEDDGTDDPAANRSSGDGSDDNRTRDASDDGNGTTEASGNGTSQTDTNGTDESDDAEPADPGWPAPGEADIRPGIPILEPFVQPPGNEGGGCTANFLFKGPLNRTLYLATAGHCVNGTDSVQLTSSFDYAADVVFAENNDTVDFGLLELNASDRDQVHPKVLGWGGPTGISQNPSLGDKLLVYGSTFARGGQDETSRLEGYATTSCNSRHYGQVPGVVGGDSGSPVIQASGEAVGVLLGGSFGVCAGHPLANDVRILPIELGVQAAEAELGVDLELVTWSLENSGQLPG